MVVVVERRPDAGSAAAMGGARARLAPPIDLVDEKEPDDDVGHAQPLEYPKGVRGSLAPLPTGKPDVDLYQWIPPGSGRLVARIELDGAADATLDLLDKNGDPLLRALPGEHLLPNLALNAGEVWFLRVRGSRASAAGTAAPVEYRLAVRAAPLQPGDEEEPNDSAERANQLQPSVEASGFYGRLHDEDWLRLPPELPAGGAARIEVSPVEGVIASLRVRDASGALLIEAKGVRGDELRLRAAPAPPGGLIVLRSEGGKNLEVPWRLRFAAEPPLDGAEAEPNGTPAGANPLVLDGGGQARVAGFLWPGDVDLYRVQVSGAGLVEATLESPPGVEARVDQASDSGAAVKPDGARPRSARQLRALPVGGELLLRVSARPRDTAFDAPYTLSISQLPGLGAEPAAPALPAAPAPR